MGSFLLFVKLLKLPFCDFKFSDGSFCPILVSKGDNSYLHCLEYREICLLALNAELWVVIASISSTVVEILPLPPYFWKLWHVWKILSFSKFLLIDMIFSFICKVKELRYLKKWIRVTIWYYLLTIGTKNDQNLDFWLIFQTLSKKMGIWPIFLKVCVSCSQRRFDLMFQHNLTEYRP